MAAIRTYYQCEACDYGSFDLKEIELHMHQTHTVDIHLENEKVSEECNSIQMLAKPAEDSDSDPSETVWSTNAIKLLISVVKQDYEKFNSNPMTPKHYLWKNISWKMAENGYNYTHVRCDNKWRSLKKTYRHTKENMRSGKDVKKWKFFDLMDEFMGDEMGLGCKEDMVAVTTLTSGLMPTEQLEPSRKRRRTATSVDDKECDRERRHREKMAEMKRFNDLFERFVQNAKVVQNYT